MVKSTGPSVRGAGGDGEGGKKYRVLKLVADGLRDRSGGREKLVDE